MKRFYQQEWHGIPFRSFARMSATEPAGADFYGAFYKAFFERYQSPDQLDPEWLHVKQQTLDFVASHPAMTKDRRILSLGCGLGLIEQKLLDAGFDHIEINEVSAEPLRWSRPRFDADKVHVGFFPQCVPADRTYDVILLIGVDGVFDQPGLIAFLTAAHRRLRPGGQAILVSWTRQPSRTALQSMVEGAKDAVKLVLDRIGLRPLGQFWGYLREGSEIRAAVQAAGFADLRDGLLPQETRFPTYWLTARKAATSA